MGIVAADRFSHVWFHGQERARRPERSLRPGFAAHLAVHRKQPAAAEPADPLIDFVLEQAGLDPAAYRPSATRRRVLACIRALQASSHAEAVALLRAHPQLVSVALEAILIGVSDFFRDRAVFDFLRTHVLPELTRPGRSLRIYSAGCSNGQELYSLAILLAEMNSLAGCQLVGADCRAPAVAAAQAGLFTEASLPGLTPELRSRYFQRENAGWRITEELRRRTQWRVESIFAAKEPMSWDLILFRNVAIYLTAEKLEPVWTNLTAGLTPGGLLVTGRAERPPALLPLVRLAPCIYRKSENRSSSLPLTPTFAPGPRRPSPWPSSSFPWA
jgi:chemotaxis protein methyltransferase CheR